MVIQLNCVVQEYAWGKVGQSSFVAQLKEACDTEFCIKPDGTYAELWMGTHASGPSTVYGTNGTLLSDYLKQQPDATGLTNLRASAPDGDLPFLFKVLSIAKALSIQAHPDSKLAQKLHKEKPSTYKDANHKPEIAIALTPFEALCQFRPLDEIVEFLINVPEFSALISDTLVERFIQQPSEPLLREIFAAYLEADKNVVATQISLLCNRLEKEKELTPLYQLIYRLNQQFPSDLGCFSPFLLNYIILQPGEAVFLSANEPHAYLSGDCVECMACSDNVVRAGLTPKYVDKETLRTMLTYNSGKPIVLQGDKVNSVTKVYSPPVPEFEVEVVTLQPQSSHQLQPRVGGSIVLAVSGNGALTHAQNEAMKISKGSVFFSSAKEDLSLMNEGNEPLIVFRASPNENK